MDLQAGPQSDRDTYTTDPPPSRGELVRTAFGDHMRQIGRLPGVMRYTAQGIGRVRRSSKKLSPELTRPFTPPPSFMNHRVDAQRKFATATLALADIKETAKHLGVTINDMVLAISAGALRELSLKYDGQADHPLSASVPVSFDFSRERISGNYFTGVMMVVPIQLTDPLERVQAVHDAAVDAKETHHLLGPELVSRWAAYFPPAPAERLFHWLADKDGQNKVLNIPISNVPGPREPGRVGGALVTEIYSVGPLTTGSGLNITVWSYVDQLNISVLSDGATLSDPHELTDAMIDAFVDIRRAAGLSVDLTVIETAMAQ
jgi:diacylglycerol O-acyltransferase